MQIKITNKMCPLARWRCTYIGHRNGVSLHVAPARDVNDQRSYVNRMDGRDNMSLQIGLLNRGEGQLGSTYVNTIKLMYLVFGTQ